MKRTLFLWCFVMAILLTSCGYSQEDLDAARASGYEDGYIDGYYNAQVECADETSSARDYGYDEGYSDGYDDGYTESKYNLEAAKSDAERYARNNSEWSLYEALQIVGIVHGYMETDDPTDAPTQREYLDAIDTLYLFGDFFDARKYE